MNSQPLITVVIPLYNKQAHIARCLKSVLAQTYDHYQVVVVDDGSTDDSAAVAASWLRGADELIRQPNGGVSAARNRGMTAAQGELIALLDADDEWHPAHLRNLAGLFTDFPQARVYGTGYAIHQWRLATEITLKRPSPGYISFFEASGIESIINSSCAALHREAFAASGGFMVGQPMGEDIHFLCRLCLRWPLAYHPQVTSIYHRDVANSACVTHGGPPNRLVCEWLLQALREGEIRPELRDQVSGYVARNLLGHAEYYLALGERERAAEVLGHEVLAGPRWRAAAACWRLAVRALPPWGLRAYRRGGLALSLVRPEVRHGHLKRTHLLRTLPQATAGA